jgi:stage III sporulation protein AE
MKVLLIILLLVGLIIPVQANEIAAPPVTGEAEVLMPDGMPSFGEGLWYITKTAIKGLVPDFIQDYRLCLTAIGIAILISLLNSFNSKTSDMVNMAGVLGTSTLLLGTASTLIHTASETVREISSYGKLLLPVMTAAVAAQGGTGSSAVLYTGTAFFDTLLGSVISSVLIPMVYLFLTLVIGHCAMGENLLKQLRDLFKWLIAWCMKTILYVFTGYMSLSSVITGGADKAALKAAKMAISSAVPVVGGIMSDASETILLSAGVVKNAVGVYGLLAIIAILIMPFLRIGILYLLLKCTVAVCGFVSSEKISELIKGFSEAMGVLLGMTGTVSLLFLISIVCFLKGVSG